MDYGELKAFYPGTLSDFKPLKVYANMVSYGDKKMVNLDPNIEFMDATLFDTPVENEYKVVITCYNKEKGRIESLVKIFE